MDHQVLGTREDGEWTHNYQMVPERPFPFVAGMVRAKPTKGKGGKGRYQGECCLGRGKISVRTSTIPGLGLTVTDQSALGTKSSPSI